MRNIGIVIFLFFIFFSCNIEAASDAEVIVTSSVDRSTITIGDRIHYKIDIAYPEKTQLEVPGIGIHLGEFEVKDYHIEEPKKQKDGRIHAVYEYVISTFTTGDYTIPPVPINYKTPEGISSQVFTDKIDIKVESVKVSETGDIKDIRSPVKIKGGLDWWWWALIIAVIGGVLGFGIFYWYKYKTKIKITPPPRPPYKIAIEELEKLLLLNLIEQGRFREFYFLISEIIRRYLGGRFLFNAIDFTTFELLEKLPDLDISKELTASIEKFCRDSDLVKFADYIPQDSENAEIVNLAKEILEISKPKPVVLQDAGPTEVQEVKK